MPSIDPNIDEKDFANSCLSAARDFGTSAHYLIAVAFVESGIKNIGSPTSTAFGPFQILQETWIANMADPRLGLTAEDRFDPMMQPGVAAKLAAEGTDALSAILPDKRLPTAGELYFVHLFGQHGAVVILGRDNSRSIRDALIEVYSPAPNADSKADAVIAANKPLMTDAAGHPLTVEDLLQAVDQRLDQGFSVAVKLINQVEPNLVTGPSASAFPTPDDTAVPWMTIAKQQLAKQVTEGDPQIRKYFIATTLDPVPPGHVAWCAAFVAFCIFNCGDPARKIKRSARAEDWLSVGDKLPGPQLGAVAVLEPLVDGSSGHVGFVAGWNSETLQLLAGNQTPPGGAAHAVCIKPFKMSEVRGWRMP
jgi:uncharacterized protein (TIGR02594 family)